MYVADFELGEDVRDEARLQQDKDWAQVSSYIFIRHDGRGYVSLGCD